MRGDASKSLIYPSDPAICILAHQAQESPQQPFSLDLPCTLSAIYKIQQMIPQQSKQNTHVCEGQKKGEKCLGHGGWKRGWETKVRGRLKAEPILRVRALCWVRFLSIQNPDAAFSHSWVKENTGAEKKSKREGKGAG
jgi:hypothetical protein